jgi:hypothetical protein
MFMSYSRFFGLVAWLAATCSCAAAGTWVPLVHAAPGPAGHFLPLSDGTIMAEANPYGYGQGWYRLVPDLHGSYVNGTWTNMATMHYTRLDFGSVVLQSGRVLVVGGEYGTGKATAEVYDPVPNTWTVVPVPTSLLNPTLGSPEVGENQGFSDSIAKIVANGQVLIAPVAGNAFGATMLFNPVSDTWAAGPQTVRRAYPDQAEASWVKLPDDSVLTVDGATTTAERYIPASNTWVSDANVPVTLYDSYGIEEGPGLLLPNGKAIFFGGTGHTAIYTPSGTTSPGSWVAGPDFPNGQGMPDAPAAMLVNGKILCAVCQAPYATNHIYNSPISFYEYDYVGNSFTQVSAPGGGSTLADVAFAALMCELPDGTILFGHRQTDFYVYQPDGVVLAAGKPAISIITTNTDGSLHLTGTLFNGLSEGAAYGDDEQMDSNFPLVRFIDIHGNVRYGRTFNWSRTSVMTGSAVVSTDCAIPPGATPADLIQVVANGIASDAPSTMVYTMSDSGPGSLRQAVASAAPGSVIRFDPLLAGQTITITSGEIDLNTSLTLDGSGPGNAVRINGNHASRIFGIPGGVSATLTALLLTNGFTTNGNWGGAIANSGTLTLSNCTLAGNGGDSSVAGGAIENEGTLILAGCTVVGNSSGFAGAIDNRGGCLLQNSTFSGNTAFSGNGGAIDNPYSATLSLVQCTFAGNSATGAGGGIDNYLSQVNLTNSILAGDIGQDIYNWSGSTVSAGGSNIVQNLGNAGTLIGGGCLLGTDPMLGPLADHGGPTLTMLPQIGSPAIDAGVTSLAAGLPYDQRGPGYPRVVGDSVDIGAVEAGVVPYVFTLGDAGYGSLRYALNYCTNNAQIVFAPSLAGQSILLTSGPVVLNQNVTIDASALTNGLEISGSHNSQVLTVGSGANVVLNSLKIANGYSASGFGGGMESFGNLTLNDCQLMGNQCGGTGGALAAAFGSLTLNHTTVSGNSCDNCSGIYVQDQPCTLLNSTISGNSGAAGDAVRVNAANSYTPLAALNSTLSGNTAGSVTASALTLQSAAGVTAAAFLTNCTVVNNTVTGAGEPGAIYLQPGGGGTVLGLYNTIVSGNSSGGAPDDITGTVDPGSADNLVGTGGGLVNGVNGNLVGINNPQLASLGNYGGPTETMPPLAGSPVVDAGNDAIAGALTIDQRGFPRRSGAHVDIGAVELQFASSPALLMGASLLGNGSFGFTFTNLPGGSFTVLTSTNIALPVNTWSNLGPALEMPPGSGHFQFNAPNAKSGALQFYRVRSP